VKAHPMFTGIITAIGTLEHLEKSGDWGLRIKTPWECSAIDLGASIACSGICLTVTRRAADWFEVEASAETVAKTSLSDWQPGQRINLERALKMGDELGGHMVSGHVDGTAELLEIVPDQDSHRLLLACPLEFAGFVASKGSVALDGISLTVNEVAGNQFGVNIISHSWQQTTLSDRAPGDRLNFEVDMLARYVARMTEIARQQQTNTGK